MDSVISRFPNSNAARILAVNYQKILDRISMANPNSCTHIKVSGVRCNSPALRGEQFCYFHQQAHRGVRRPPFARLHPIAVLEDADSIQASLMEVINGIVRNTLDVKRAELIIRALHIAAKNVRNLKFDSQVHPKVKEVPQYAMPVAENLEWKGSERDTVLDLEVELPAVAAKPPKPIDPNDPHFHERFEEGGRNLKRDDAQRRAAETELRAAHAQLMASKNAEESVPAAESSASRKGLPQPSCLSKAKNPMLDSGSASAASKSGAADAFVRPGVNPGKHKPPINVKPNGKYTPAPQERKSTAQRANAG